MSSKLKLFAVILTFTLPFIAAHLLYSYKNKIKFNTVNSGELLIPPLVDQDLGLHCKEFLGKWQLLYVKPVKCDKVCQETIALLQRLHIALGKDQKLLQLRLQNLESHEILKEGTIWIIDPAGFLIMRYSSEYNAKGMLKDIRRLLRYTHVR